MDKTEQEIRRLLINWFHIKDEIPFFNSASDPLYHQKFSLLVHAIESLNSRPYQEWSDEADFRLTDGWDKSSATELSGNTGQVDSIRYLIRVIIYGRIEITEETRLLQVNMVDRFLEGFLYFLSDLPSHQILRVMKEVAMIGEEDLGLLSFESRQDQLILHGIEAIQKGLTAAIKAINLGEFDPLLYLCEVTLYILTFERLGAVNRFKGSQQRRAALIKNKANIKTKQYAISLYEEKHSGQDGINMRAAARSIHTEVVEYGKTVNWYWNDDFQAHELIYNWIRKRPIK